MKTKRYVLGITAMTVLLASALPVYAAQEEKDNMPDVTMKQIADANTRENLLKHYDSYLVEVKDTLGGGKMSLYGDKELRYADYGEQQEAYLENEKGYQHVNENDIYAGLLYSFEPDMTSFENPVFNYAYTLKEQITETKTEDGKMIVTTELNSDDTKEVLENSGYEYTEGDYCRYEYTLDPDTCILYSSDGTLYHADGNSEEYGTMVVSTDAECPEMAQELYDRLTSTETRTVTIVLDPETEKETTYSSTAVKGDAVLNIMPEGYNHLYTDSECKEEFDGSSDKTKDIVLYSMPDEEK